MMGNCLEMMQAIGGAMGGMIWWLPLGLLLAAGFLTLSGTGVLFLAYLARQRPSTQPPLAVRILQERFARGDISYEEYEERLQALQY